MNKPKSKGFSGDRWTIYQKILKQNYMNHQEIYTIFQQFITANFKTPFSLLDLGCGDAEFMTQALTGQNITLYQGIDLSEDALAIAQKNLEHLPCNTKLITGDFYQLLPDLVHQTLETFDIILASFSLHHLSLEQKEETFANLYKLLNSQGVFFLVDIVRLADESRDAYIDRALQSMQQHWSLLTADELTLVGENIAANDFPETLETLVTLAEQQGFSRSDRLYQDPRKTSNAIVFYK